MGCSATGGDPTGCIDSCAATGSPVVRIPRNRLRLSVPLGDLLAGAWSAAAYTFGCDSVPGGLGAGVAWATEATHVEIVMIDSAVVRHIAMVMRPSYAKSVRL